MIYLFSFICFIGGYLAGFLIRWLFTHLRWGNTTCNIHKKGSYARFIGSLFVAFLSVYFQIPLLFIFVGFMVYESRARWCIVRNFQS